MKTSSMTTETLLTRILASLIGGVFVFIWALLSGKDNESGKA